MLYAILETLFLTCQDDRKYMKYKKMIDKTDIYTFNNDIYEKFLNF